MPRDKHKLWIGKNDRVMPPPGVTLRIFARAKGCCQDCRRRLMAGEKWIRDHIVALEDGGENTEANIQILCTACSTKKTSSENSERAKVKAKTKAAYGITGPKQKIRSAGFPKRREREPKPTLPPKSMFWPVGNARSE